MDEREALFLSQLYKETEQLCFKGGTYLKHALGLDRFSEDLDFTSVDRKGHIDALQAAARRMRRFGVGSVLEEQYEDQRSQFAKLRYEGPLYTGNERSRGSIAIDVSKRDDILLQPVWRRLFFHYPELRVVNVLGLTDDELISEKLRAMSLRKRARNLYDVWFLLNLGLQVDPLLLKRKILNVVADETVTIRTDAKEWERDLTILIEDPPPFEEVKKYVIGQLRKREIPVVE